jgi:hypothetical protein
MNSGLNKKPLIANETIKLSSRQLRGIIRLAKLVG